MIFFFLLFLLNNIFGHSRMEPVIFYTQLTSIESGKGLKVSSSSTAGHWHSTVSYFSYRLGNLLLLPLLKDDQQVFIFFPLVVQGKCHFLHAHSAEKKGEWMIRCVIVDHLIRPSIHRGCAQGPRTLLPPCSCLSSIQDGQNARNHLPSQCAHSSCLVKRVHNYPNGIKLFLFFNALIIPISGVIKTREFTNPGWLNIALGGRKKRNQVL